MNINGQNRRRQGLSRSQSRDGIKKFVGLQRRTLSRIYDSTTRTLQKKVTDFVSHIRRAYKYRYIRRFHQATQQMKEKNLGKTQTISTMEYSQSCLIDQPTPKFFDTLSLSDDTILFQQNTLNLSEDSLELSAIEAPTLGLEFTYKEELNLIAKKKYCRSLMFRQGYKPWLRLTLHRMKVRKAKTAYFRRICRTIFKALIPKRKLAAKARQFWIQKSKLRGMGIWKKRTEKIASFKAWKDVNSWLNQYKSPSVSISYKFSRWQPLSTNINHLNM